MSEVRKTLLVTTALESTWGDEWPTLFAGEWCRIYSRRQVWSRLDHEVLEYHWEDREKLARNYHELEDLYERILVALSARLNAIHGKNEDTGYWRIVLGTWLMSYVAVLFDRWETLRLVFERGDVSYVTRRIEGELEIAWDHNDHYTLVAADEWNAKMFQRILDYAYANRIEYLPDTGVSAKVDRSGEEPEVFAAIPRKTRPVSLLKRLIVRTIYGTRDFLIRARYVLGSKKVRVFLYHAYFAPQVIAKISRALKQSSLLGFPGFEFEYQGAANSSAREKPLDFDARNEFEKFCAKYIFRDFPAIYIEGFEGMREYLKSIPIEAEIIATANAHFASDPFKVWTAEKIKAGAKYFILTHGGGFPIGLWLFHHEEKSSHKLLTWFREYYDNQRRLPPNKPLPAWYSPEAKYLTVIGVELTRYTYRVETCAMGPLVLKAFEHTRDFIAALDEKASSDLLVKPYPNMGWETGDRYSDVFGPEKVDQVSDYYSILRQSRLVVCTYPGSNLSEAMASGIPVLLVYPSRYWEVIPRAAELIDVMSKAGIVHTDPQAAARHASRVWEDPMKWWNEPQVIAARKKYVEDACDLEGGPLDWIRFFKEQLGEKPSSKAERLKK
ncbi:MAG: hypothetical protein H7A21_11855 [Spirochaetales bacterium]|nr:hypothetical protein [Spirochaetales bacterium]MCP5484922.1 hypothetical protein [Spirochaetales bacterium]